ncbi:type II toxin-antitoxin system VapC family toxin [Novosphingobium sp. SG707]|uniref:type II toxin-antitoxin system VapC family toxin n=1 Tax=Novosphingobium sp. SG707 TaxID=2586996 RepID=UPI0032C0D358
MLDASALLCLLFDEAGAEKVEARLDLARICAVNYQEVLVALVDRGIKPENAQTMLGQLDIEIVPMDRAQANIAGALRPLTRASGLSLGDLCCLALAWTSRAVALTTDRAWADLDIGIAIEVVQ